MILGCDAAGIGPDGNEVVVYPRGGRRPATRGTVDPVRALPGHARRAGRGAAANLVPKPAGADVRRRGLPADGLADRVPDADHQGPARRRRGGAGAGRRRRRRHRGGRARRRARRAGVRDQPRRRQARADRGARRDRAGARRPAARAGRRGDRDRRRGDVRPLDEVRRRRARGSWSPARRPGTGRRSTCAGCSRCSWRSSARAMGTPDELGELLALWPDRACGRWSTRVFGFSDGARRRSPSCTRATSSARSCSTTRLEHATDREPRGLPVGLWWWCVSACC